MEPRTQDALDFTDCEPAYPTTEASLFPNGLRVAFRDEPSTAFILARIAGERIISAEGLGATPAHALASLFDDLFTDLDQMQVADADHLLTTAGKRELEAIKRVVYGR